MVEAKDSLMIFLPIEEPISKVPKCERGGGFAQVLKQLQLQNANELLIQENWKKSEVRTHLVLLSWRQ
jgi:hypothetical protein